jgi:hypothetical protein
MEAGCRADILGRLSESGLTRAVTRWPPIIWPLMTFGSLLILVGSSGRLDPSLVAGGALALVVRGVSRVAVPGAQALDRAATASDCAWAIAGVVVFYMPVRLAASAGGGRVRVGRDRGGGDSALAVALLLATMRSRIAEPDGRLRDDSGDPDEDSAPASAWTIRLRLATPPTTPAASTSPTSLRAGAGNTQLPTSPVPKRAASVDKDHVF